MSRTRRNKKDFYSKESSRVRKWWTKRFRLKNKQNVKDGRPIEKKPKTEGWLTW